MANLQGAADGPLDTVQHQATVAMRGYGHPLNATRDEHRGRDDWRAKLLQQPDSLKL